MKKFVVRHVSSKGPWDESRGFTISFRKRRPSEVVPDGVIELDDDKGEKLMYGELSGGSLTCHPLTDGKGWNVHDFQQELQIQPCGKPAHLYYGDEKYPMYSEYQVVIPNDFKFYVLIQSSVEAARILHVPEGNPEHPTIYSRGDMLHQAIEKGYASPEMLDQAGLVTTSQAASILNVDRSLILRWCREGRFPGAQKFGNAWALSGREVQVFVKKERKVGAPDGNQNAKRN